MFPRWWPASGLWRHPAFLRLWAAQVVSAMGSRITRTALPVIAVTVIAASPGEVAVLSGMAFVPGLLLALVAGGHIDRGDKRRLLVAADLVRAAAVATVPIAHWTVGVGLIHLVAVAGVVGAASALFQITDNAYLPQVVGRDHLVEGNAKLEATESIAEIVGPAAAGGLIRGLGAPLAVVLDALTYLWSAAFLVGLPSGPEPAGRAARRRPLADLGDGVRAIRGHAGVRRLVAAAMIAHAGAGFFLALYMVFTLRVLALDEATVGIVIGFGGVGALLGAIAAPRLAVGLGLGPTMVGALAVSSAASFLIPAAEVVDGRAAELAVLIAHQLLGDGAMVVFAVHAVTVRQTVLPDDVLGRANAAVHVLTIAALLAGAVVAGIAGELLGAGAGLLIGAAAGMTAPLALLGHAFDVTAPGAPPARS